MSLRMCVSVPMSVGVGVWMSSLSRMRPSLVGSAADDVPHSAKLPGCKAAMVHPQPHPASCTRSRRNAAPSPLSLGSLHILQPWLTIATVHNMIK